ncbi:CBS domain-containing protein [Streptomyces sp. NPDC019443]|uniref:CBS domain-containing protein n=1 Tax=Streptomyces sp. NPDC019443 TaxID=3365061 RepID=UPI0037B27755
MATAREIMTPGTECIGAEDSVLEAARTMTELGVGGLPICGTDNSLKDMLTNRDIGEGPRCRQGPGQTKAGELAQAKWSPSARTTTRARSCAPWPRTRCAASRSSDHDLVGIVALADPAGNPRRRPPGNPLHGLTTRPVRP